MENIGCSIERPLVENKLYKFRSDYNFIVSEILGSYFYICTPEKINDPYDSIYCNYEKDKLSNLLLYFCEYRKNGSNNRIKKHYAKYKDDEMVLITDFAYNVSKFYKIEQVDILNFLLNKVKINNAKFPANIKICSFTERNDSVPMWAYYGDSHKGVCFEYNFSQNKKIKSKIFKVHYSDLMPKNKYGLYSPIMKGFDWSHELEWRYVETTNNTDKVNNKCLKSIYLGKMCSKENEKLIIETIKKSGRKINLYKACNDLVDYKIHFRKIDC